MEWSIRDACWLQGDEFSALLALHKTFYKYLLFSRFWNFGKVPTLQQKWLMFPEQNALEKETPSIYICFHNVYDFSSWHIILYIFWKSEVVSWYAFRGWVDMHVSCILYALHMHCICYWCMDMMHWRTFREGVPSVHEKYHLKYMQKYFSLSPGLRLC